MLVVATAIRYAQVSGLSFAVNIGLTVFLHEVCCVPEELAFAIALIVVFLMNFVAMRHYIYAGNGGHAGKQFIMYAGSALVFRGSEYLTFLILHSWLRLDYRLAVIGVAVGFACAKFFYYRLVFEPQSPECVAEKEMGPRVLSTVECADFSQIQGSNVAVDEEYNQTSDSN